MTANEISRWKVRPFFLFWLCAIVVLPWVVTSLFFSVPYGGVYIIEFSNARQLAVGCKFYANGHQGKFPDNLRDLVPTYINDEETFKKLMFRSPDDNSIHEWS